MAEQKGGDGPYPRVQIKLKYNSENQNMLELIRCHIGGTIHYEKKKKAEDQIVWVAIAQKHVKNILTIFEKYPLLTSRKICQYNYLKDMHG